MQAMQFDAEVPPPRRVGLRVTFYERAKKDEAESAAQGMPIYKKVEYVSLEQPGDRTSIIDRPARPSDKLEFPRQYAAFKANQDQDVADGFPLKEWPAIDIEMVAMFRDMKVFTVEQLASVPDAVAQKMGPISKLRQKAKDFVAQAKGGAPLVQMREQLDAKENEIATMKQQMADLIEDMKKLKAKKG